MIRPLRFVAYLPRNSAVVMLRLYRAAVSPVYGDVCRYYPSCSAYGLRAVQQHGAMRGVVKTLWRLLRCHPWAAGGIDDVKLRSAALATTRFGFVTGSLASLDDPRFGFTHFGATQVGSTQFGSITSGIEQSASMLAPPVFAHAHAHSHGKG